MNYKIENNGYLVESNYDLTQELKANPKQIINWSNFEVKDKFYDNNGNDYWVMEVSHDSKYIRLY